MPLIYCNELYPDYVKGGLLAGGHIRYLQQTADGYPFQDQAGNMNTELAGEIMNACAFVFQSTAYGGCAGEFWTSVRNPQDGSVWGLFVLIEPFSGGNGEFDNQFIFRYALCSVGSISLLSRTELLSCIKHAQMIKKWGKCEIDGRKVSFPPAPPRVKALLELLNHYPSAQLIYGEMYESNASFWLEQVWKFFSRSGTNTSILFSYQTCWCEIFLKNPYALPQLLLFPGRIFDRMDRSRTGLPLRDRTSGEAPCVLSISQVEGTGKYLGRLVYPSSAFDSVKALAKMPKHLADQNRLDSTALDRICQDNSRGSQQTKADRRIIIYHFKTARNVEVHHLPFSFGRSADRDFVITDNPMISSDHAEIIYSNQKYYLVDHNSKNGTFISGKRLKEGEKALLHEEDQFYIGNELFLIRFL